MCDYTYKIRGPEAEGETNAVTEADSRIASHVTEAISFHLPRYHVNLFTELLPSRPCVNDATSTACVYSGSAEYVLSSAALCVLYM
jgi:hypothetical protein